MQWLTENWVWVLLLGGMAAMHLFGHGRGGHGGGSDSRRHGRNDNPTDDGPDDLAGA